MQTRVGGMAIGDNGIESHQVVDLPGYLLEARMFTSRSARWFKDDACRARNVLKSRVRIGAALKAKSAEDAAAAAAAGAAAAGSPADSNITPRSVVSEVREGGAGPRAAVAGREKRESRVRKPEGRGARK